MATTAQLAGEIAHLNNANYIAILFAEQSGNTLFASLASEVSKMFVAVADMITLLASSSTCFSCSGVTDSK